MLTQEEFLAKLPTEVTIEGIISENKVFIDGISLDLQASLQIHDHSRDGFSWGFSGSGPAQFALALLMAFVDASTAHRYHQRLKFGWISGLPQKDFKIKNFNLRHKMAEILKDSHVTE